MQFVSTFEIPVPIEETWSLLGDIPKIAPCLPGASVRPLTDDTYEGEVAVKVGPIRAGYSGQATVTQRSDTDHVMVLEGKGTEGAGKGTASAVITLKLSSVAAGRTSAEVVTDLTITGRLAQFGRSAMADVSQRLIDQFAANLAALASGADAATSERAAAPPGSLAATPDSASRTPTRAAPNDNELDAMSLVVPMIKRSLPVIGGIAGTLLLSALVGAARGQKKGANAPMWGEANMVHIIVPATALTSCDCWAAARAPETE